MKKVIILHGYGDTPDSVWLPYVKKELEKKGYKVSLPQLPDTEDPKLSEQLDYVLRSEKFDKETILIGRSSGGSLILAILEKIDFKVKQAILVAGYSSPLKVDPENTKNIKSEYDWDKIKTHCSQFVFVNSDNDPWGADDSKGREMFEKLGGKLIVVHGEGHFGSQAFKQPYKEFPFLLKLID